MSERTLFLWLLIFATSCTALKKNDTAQPLRIAFYNVENLFDLDDDPFTFDEDFTPTGKQVWTQDRYDTKLARIDKVVGAMGHPALLGLCEVENRKVLNDLSNTGSMKSKGYQIAHFDSPDKRGIDVALLYQPKYFKIKKESFVRVEFSAAISPEEPDYTSRDILVVEGLLSQKIPVIVFVVHFPSRRGGAAESEPKRLHTATYLKNKVKEMSKENPDARFVIMGDFNDETTDKSIVKIIGAAPINDHIEADGLYNCFAHLDAQNQGSYKYRGDWNMLDQIILSGHFFQSSSKLKYADSHIFKAEFLLYKDEKNGPSPNRTYGGTRYFGGYSDHLPVFIELKEK